MPESFFSYNLSRPYPYGWFTWVVIVAGLAATALFSVINLAADGYNLITVFSLNPNSTVAETWWFQKKPWSLTSKLSTSCQPQDLITNSQVWTSHDGLMGGLIYTLRDAQGNNTFQATLPYLNNVLEDCSIMEIIFTWTNGSRELPGTDSISVNTFVFCSLIPEIGLSIGLETIISIPGDNEDPKTGSGGWYAFHTSFPALRWIDDLIDTYVFYLRQLLMDTNLGQYHDMAQLRTDTYLADGKTTLNPDYSSLRLSIMYQNGTRSDPIGSGPPDTNSDIIAEAIYVLLKILLSGILTDLGQKSSSNLFAQPVLLLQLLQEHNVSGSGTPWPFPLAPPPGANISAFYQNQGNPLPPIDPATIATRYLCQVPQLKSTDSLIISILVADLVFLQVLWQIFNWAVTSTLERRYPTARYCEGCVKELHEDYSPINQTDPAAHVEAGKGLGVEVARDSRSCIAVESRRESMTEGEPTQEPPVDEPTQEPPVDEPTKKSPVHGPTPEPPAPAATA